jgi:hypothetical protein
MRSGCPSQASASMGSVDTKRLSGEVAARHGLLIREDDPAMALVTMSEIVLEQVLSEAQLRLRALLSEAEKGQKRSQQETLVWVQEEMGRTGTALRVQVQRDIDAGRLQAKELVVQLSRVYSRSVVRRWVAVGIVSGLLLVLIGVGLGVELGRWLR